MCIRDRAYGAVSTAFPNTIQQRDLPLTLTMFNKPQWLRIVLQLNCVATRCLWDSQDAIPTLMCLQPESVKTQKPTFHFQQWAYLPRGSDLTNSWKFVVNFHLSISYHNNVNLITVGLHQRENYYKKLFFCEKSYSWLS